MIFYLSFASFQIQNIVLKEKITTKLPVMKKIIGSENELCIFCSSVVFICMCLLEEESVEHGFPSKPMVWKGYF